MNRFITRTYLKVAETLNTTDDRGGVAAEYGVLLAGIVGVVAIAAAALGGRIGGLFDSILP
ncbi:MAG: Flp family type IVb pilin [Actinomycetota bacterium]|jgi:Flp pilus assembly pilin Flp|nr:Flp family type IVb pilin [Actinomycetota bacterium]MDA3015525.1 Flp family type IVb pilin [Actinomycetota bacterium]MDA3028168.1 Flp family type IVb pilin [Actinomycetota bacterium]